LLEEINRKLSGADIILSKAKAKIEGLDLEDDDPPKKEVAKEERIGINLYRIYSS